MQYARNCSRKNKEVVQRMQGKRNHKSGTILPISMLYYNPIFPTTQAKETAQRELSVL
jgi:hypothetical protein